MAVPDKLGDFEVVEEIGRGGFGIVYRARQASLDRPVALKVLYRHLIHTEEDIGRFEREARAAARLDHPAIVSVYAWGGDGDDFFIAQRLIGRGRTLADELVELRQAEAPPKGYFRQVAERIARIAEGLHHAHGRGIVHRDVKPSNILIDDAGLPCLGDFGLAKVEDGLELSRTGDFAGSPFYMSPEQADSKVGPIDHRTDVYSLGITLYEAITLEQPFTGKTSHEIVRKILTEEPRPPGRVLDRVPTDLETICLHAIDKAPSRRYQSAQELAHDLHAFLDGEPISAVPVGAISMLLRKARRHGQAVGLVVLGATLILGGGWAWRQMNQQQKQMQQQEVESSHQDARASLEKTRTETIQAVDAELGPQIRAAMEDDPQRALALMRQRDALVAQVETAYDSFSNEIKERYEASDPGQIIDVVGTFQRDGLLAGGLRVLGGQALSTSAAGDKPSSFAGLFDRPLTMDPMDDPALFEEATGEPLRALGPPASPLGSAEPGPESLGSTKPPPAAAAGWEELIARLLELRFRSPAPPEEGTANAAQEAPAPPNG